MAELSQLEVCRGKVTSLLPVLAETTRHRQYVQHCHYFETVMKQVVNKYVDGYERERKGLVCASP